jgi:hypothetical protein
MGIVSQEEGSENHLDFFNSRIPRGDDVESNRIGRYLTKSCPLITCFRYCKSPSNGTTERKLYP